MQIQLSSQFLGFGNAEYAAAVIFFLSQKKKKKNLRPPISFIYLGKTKYVHAVLLFPSVSFRTHDMSVQIFLRKIVSCFDLLIIL